MKRIFLLICVLILSLCGVYATEFFAYSALAGDYFTLILTEVGSSGQKSSFGIIISSRSHKNRALMDCDEGYEIAKLMQCTPNIFIGSELGVDFTSKRSMYYVDFTNNTLKNKLNVVFTDPNASDDGSIEFTTCLLYSVTSTDGVPQPFSEDDYFDSCFLAMNLARQILSGRTYVVFTSSETLDKQIMKIEVDEDSAKKALADLDDFICLIY